MGLEVTKAAAWGAGTALRMAAGSVVPMVEASVEA